MHYKALVTPQIPVWRWSVAAIVPEHVLQCPFALTPGFYHESTCQTVQSEIICNCRPQLITDGKISKDWWKLVSSDVFSRPLCVTLPSSFLLQLHSLHFISPPQRLPSAPPPPPPQHISDLSHSFQPPITVAAFWHFLIDCIISFFFKCTLFHLLSLHWKTSVMKDCSATHRNGKLNVPTAFKVQRKEVSCHLRRHS